MQDIASQGWWCLHPQPTVAAFYKDRQESTSASYQLFKIQHRAEDMEAELPVIVDSGGRGIHLIELSITEN